MKKRMSFIKMLSAVILLFGMFIPVNISHAQPAEKEQEVIVMDLTKRWGDGSRTSVFGQIVYEEGDRDYSGMDIRASYTFECISENRRGKDIIITVKTGDPLNDVLSYQNLYFEGIKMYPNEEGAEPFLFAGEGLNVNTYPNQVTWHYSDNNYGSYGEDIMPTKFLKNFPYFTDHDMYMVFVDSAYIDNKLNGVPDDKNNGYYREVKMRLKASITDSEFMKCLFINKWEL